MCIYCFRVILQPSHTHISKGRLHVKKLISNLKYSQLIYQEPYTGKIYVKRYLRVQLLT